MQKHICCNLQGEVKINKSCMADLTDMIRISPNASRVLMFLFAHIDNKNSLITNLLTVSKMLGMTETMVKNSLILLSQKNYIDLYTVKLNHHNRIMKYIHDKKLWQESKHKIWKIVDKKLLTEIHLSQEYIKITVNNFIATGRNKDNKDNNILLHIDKNLFYDKRIKDDEILWEI